jgi:hypothetical protein
LFGVKSDTTREKYRKERRRISSFPSSSINQNDHNQCDNIGVASKSDVSQNTPRADETEDLISV